MLPTWLEAKTAVLTSVLSGWKHVDHADDGSRRSIDPAHLRDSAPGLRPDLLRRALRRGSIDHDGIREDLDLWIELFAEQEDPALLVLILELLSPVSDTRVLDLAREACRHRADGVRLEGLRMLLDRRPEETPALAARHRHDDSLEIRLMLAERMVELDVGTAVDLLFEILQVEREGPRESHALERTTELLVERVAPALAAPERDRIVARIHEIQPGHDDGEGFLDWAADRLRRDP